MSTGNILWRHEDDITTDDEAYYASAEEAVHIFVRHILNTEDDNCYPREGLSIEDLVEREHVAIGYTEIQIKSDAHLDSLKVEYWDDDGDFLDDMMVGDKFHYSISRKKVAVRMRLEGCKP